MEITYLDIVYLALISILIALMVRVIAKYMETNPKLSKKFERGKQIRKFFIKYPWIFAIINFFIMIVLTLLE